MPKSDSHVIEQVIQVEKRWVQAHRDLDLAIIEEILAEDYVQIRSDGAVIGKAEAMESYRSKKRRWDYADSDEHRISVYGDIAILLGRWIARGQNDGFRFDYTARLMAIYVRRDSGWQLVADQATTLRE